MGDPDRLRDGAEPGVLEEGRHFFRDLVEHPEALRNDRRADLHGARARHDVLERIPAGPDAADTDHGDVDLLADVVDGAHADRANRGTAQSAEAIRERGHLQLRRDRHRLQRVDRHNPIGSAPLRGDRKRRDVLDVRGELREDRKRDDILHRTRELLDRVFLLRDLGPETFRMGTGEVQLDRLHAVCGHLRGHGGILVRVLPEDGADDSRPRGVGALHLLLVLNNARVREADRVQQAGVELDDRWILIAFSRLGPDALRDHGPRTRLVDPGHGPPRLIEKSGREHRRVPESHPGDLGPEVYHRTDRNDGRPKAFGWSNLGLLQTRTPGPSLHIFRRMTTLLSPNGATILKPCFLNMETVPRYSRYAPHRTIGYASTRPPPFFLMASRAPFNATLATPCLRCFRSTTKQVILQSFLTSPSRASLR